MNEEVAAGLRALARAFEKGSNAYGGYTCIAVNHKLGWNVKKAYADVFDFGFNSHNAEDLWYSDNETDLRVLMLCFAAAMAETGDL